jgi:hypothetical protein
MFVENRPLYETIFTMRWSQMIVGIAIFIPAVLVICLAWRSYHTFDYFGWQSGDGNRVRLRITSGGGQIAFSGNLPTSHGVDENGNPIIYRTFEKVNCIFTYYSCDGYYQYSVFSESFWGFDFDQSKPYVGPMGMWLAVIPHWFVVMLLTIFPIAWLVRSGRRYRGRLMLKGICLQCNYDLRASKDRCPECGTPIPPSKSSGVESPPQLESPS